MDKKNPKIGTLSHLSGLMKKAKVAGVLAFAPTPYWMPRDTFYHLRVDNPNEWLYKELDKYEHIYGVITVNPKERNACRVLEEYVKKGFVGIKIHPACYEIKLDDVCFEEFYSTAEKLGVFIAFHTGVHGYRLDQYMPILLDNVAYRHPKLKIIIEHMGVPCFFEQAMAVLLNNSDRWNGFNVYAGLTGGVLDLPEPEAREKIMMMVEKVGTKRMIYGLDFPGPDPLEKLEREKALIHSLGLSKEETEDIMGNTLRRLIKNPGRSGIEYADYAESANLNMRKRRD